MVTGGYFLASGCSTVHPKEYCVIAIVGDMEAASFKGSWDEQTALWKFQAAVPLPRHVGHMMQLTKVLKVSVSGKQQYRDYGKAHWENSMWAPGIWNKATAIHGRDHKLFEKIALDLLLGPS